MNEGDQTKGNTTPERRYLILGSTGYTGIDSTDWNADSLPNIVDYDTVIVDVRSLDEKKLKLLSYDRVKEIRLQLVRLLDSKGQVIVLTDFIRSVKRPKEYPEKMGNYDWCPITIGISNESGESIIVKQKLFNSYLSNLKDWLYYLFIPSSCLSDQLTDYYGATYKTKYKIPSVPYITNRYDKVLAGAYRIEVRWEAENHRAYSSYKYYPEKPDVVTGEIVLLPLLQNIDPRQAVALVLQDLTGFVAHEQAPNWAGNLSVPHVDEIDKEISIQRKKISEKFDEVRKLGTKRLALEEYKRLLFASGVDLQEVVKRALEDLGGKVTPARYGQEEYILEFDGQEYLIEVKGVKKSISLGDLRQLTDYLLKYEEDTGKSSKGILFGNAWRNDPPQERGTKEKPEFPDNVMRRAKDLQIALVSSTAFFVAFCAFLNDQALGSQILRQMTTSVGVVDFTSVGQMKKE